MRSSRGLVSPDWSVLISRISTAEIYQLCGRRLTPFVLSPKETVLSAEWAKGDPIMCTDLRLETYPEEPLPNRGRDPNGPGKLFNGRAERETKRGASRGLESSIYNFLELLFWAPVSLNSANIIAPWDLERNLPSLDVQSSRKRADDHVRAD